MIRHCFFLIFAVLPFCGLQAQDTAISPRYPGAGCFEGEVAVGATFGYASLGSFDNDAAGFCLVAESRYNFRRTPFDVGLRLAAGCGRLLAGPFYDVQPDGRCGLQPASDAESGVVRGSRDRWGVCPPNGRRGCLRYSVQRLCGILRDAARWLRMLEPAARHAGLHLYGAGQPPSVAHVRNSHRRRAAVRRLFFREPLCLQLYVLPVGRHEVTARGGGGDVADDVHKAQPHDLFLHRKRHGEEQFVVLAAV